jgi:hypothetical protein
MKTETFTIGQRVRFRRDWLNTWLEERDGEWRDHELEEWVKLPYMTVTDVDEHDPSIVELDLPDAGTWTDEAITGMKDNSFDEDLFTL